MKINSDARFSFMGTFIQASAMFSRRASSMERDYGENITDDQKVEHRGLIVSVIMQSVAALETEIDEVITYGPGCHFGSNATIRQRQEYLAPCKEMLNKQPVLSKYSLVLHLLKFPQLDNGKQPFQDTKLLVGLRNELVHYKSKWGQDMESLNVLKALGNLNHKSPPWVVGAMNFFPHHCLSATCAVWAVGTTVKFLDHFYSYLGISSPLDLYRSRIVIDC